MQVYLIHPVSRVQDGTNRTHSASYEVYSDNNRLYVVHCSRWFDPSARKAHYSTEIYVSGRRISGTRLIEFRRQAIHAFRGDLDSYLRKF